MNVKESIESLIKECKLDARQIFVLAEAVENEKYIPDWVYENIADIPANRMKIVINFFTDMINVYNIDPYSSPYSSFNNKDEVEAESISVKVMNLTLNKHFAVSDEVLAEILEFYNLGYDGHVFYWYVTSKGTKEIDEIQLREIRSAIEANVISYDMATEIFGDVPTIPDYIYLLKTKILSIDYKKMEERLQEEYEDEEIASTDEDANQTEE